MEIILTLTGQTDEIPKWCPKLDMELLERFAKAKLRALQAAEACGDYLTGSVEPEQSEVIQHSIEPQEESGNDEWGRRRPWYRGSTVRVESRETDESRIEPVDAPGWARSNY